MSANLTLRYKLAEKAYRQASTNVEALGCLQTMFAELPKHKGTDKIQADLKQRISKLKQEIQKQSQKPSQRPGPGRPAVTRQGAGQVVLLGGPNAGKSQLLASLTNAKPKIESYPFTTRECQPGMVAWEDVTIQLVDTPPIAAGNYTPDLQDLVRQTDLVLLLLDLGTDDGGQQFMELLEETQRSKSRLGLENGFSHEEIGVTFTKTLLLYNKTDLEEANDRLAFFSEFIDPGFQAIHHSNTAPDCCEALKKTLFESLDLVRVYTWNPKNDAPDLDQPITLPRGEDLFALARKIHQDLADRLRAAKVYHREDLKNGKRVAPEYCPRDRDVIELISG